MAEIDDTIQYYTDLLLYQYINSPKARATISLLASQALCDLLPKEMNLKFDIETAVGDQLDILGEYIGLSRVVQTPRSKSYMKLVDQTDLPEFYQGFTDYTDSTLNYEYSIYNVIPFWYSEIYLTDDEYRSMLKIKMFINTMDNSLKAIDDFLYDLYGTEVYVKDFQTMNIAYFSTDRYLYSVRLARDLSILPRPMSVGIMGIYTIAEWNNFVDYYNYGDNPESPEPAFSDYLTGATTNVLMNSTVLY